ncbi:glycosyl hydrolase 30 family protein [Abortiporus biennis]
MIGPYRRASVMAALLIWPVASQQIMDVWTTTWDKQTLFSYSNRASSPINFTTPGTTSGQAIISVDDTKTFQPVYGFGGSLTDASAKLLNELKESDSDKYDQLLKLIFDPTDGAQAAGFSYLRVPLGASDFSDTAYTYDDTKGDTSLKQFNISAAPSYIFDVLNDIQGINPYIKVHLCPWSPPGWMKDSGNINGGNFLDEFTDEFATYLSKSVQAFEEKRVKVYAVSLQNEPGNSQNSYPTCKISAQQEAKIGLSLRKLLDQNGFKDIKVIGFEHNWSMTASYPIQLMEGAESAFAGVAFHCYGGSVEQQDIFADKYPEKEMYLTECSGIMSSDFWNDLKWDLENLYIGAVLHGARAALEWNLVLDENGKPELPLSKSCGTPCRGIVTLQGKEWTLNQEYYGLAHASKSILPKDQNGPFGTRIAVSTSGSKNLVVNAFVTGRVKSTDWQRYSIIVLNNSDHGTKIQANIAFRGKQATYTFPAGVTTLWWFAPQAEITTSSSAVSANQIQKRRTVLVQVNETQFIPTPDDLFPDSL